MDGSHMRTVLCLLFSIGLVAGAHALPAPGAPAVTEDGPDSVFREAERLAQALRSDAPAEALRRTAAEAGMDVPEAPARVMSLVDAIAQLAVADGAPLSSAEQAELRARIDALPAPLVTGIAELASALVAAQAARAEALDGLSAEEVAFLLEHAALGYALGESGHAHHSTNGDEAALGAGVDPVLVERVRVLAERVDTSRLVAAAASLTEAAMDTLPVLRAYAEALPVPAQPMSHACDIFEYGTYVCIRGTANDVWDRDWWLAVDLGGNDLYVNNQAGTRGTAIPVALLVDVAGADMYLAPVQGGQIVAQGAASLGAGVLVDGGGRNTYHAVADFAPPPLTPLPPAPNVIAQGAATLGAGALIDLGGPSTFLARGSTLGAPAAVTAQGAARLAGVGALMTAAVAGGSSYSASSKSDFLLVSQTPTSSTWASGPASTVAQGGAEGGAGLLIDLLGSDSYTADAHGSAATTTAQGAAQLGAGILVDAGGSDSRHARAVVDATLDMEHAVTCPPNFVCSFSNLVNVNMGSARTTAQGAAFSGLGLLAQLAGDGATNEAIARSVPLGRSAVSFAGGGGFPGTFRAEAHVVGGSADVDAHGAAQTGAGVLLSLGLGSDAYLVRAESDARAVAESTGGGSNIAAASAVGGDARPRAHGFAALGAGAIKDVSGDDVYSVEATATATAIQNGAPGSMTPGAVTFAGRALAEGAAAVALLIDLDGRDAYLSVPGGVFPGADETCWSNSPPSLPGAIDPRVAIGIDTSPPFAGLTTAPCHPVPPN